jgi:mono-ADP-ribosyltransferase sirtuin 6
MNIIGISTSAGISDFRGPTGVWTARARGFVPPQRTVSNPEPTLTHMSYVELMKNNYLKFLVSQNCDGLHLKSGIATDKIAELHGNCNCEACAKCGKVYYRQTRVNGYEHKTWLTGNKCATPDCNGRLRCTTVAFTQSMPDVCLDRATEESNKCDLSLCMGTSMRVSPACELPSMNVKSGRKKMVIVSE